MEVKRKKCKVIMLPTGNIDNYTILKSDNGIVPRGIVTVNNLCKDESLNNLYIISDDEIKEGDWCYHNVFGIGNIQLKYGEECFTTKRECINDGSVTTPWKKNVSNIIKIIATTDKSLMTENRPNSDHPYNLQLPQPSQAFIEKYCKLGGIDEVMVEYHRAGKYGDGGWIPLKYIPKVNSYNKITIHSIKDSWSRKEVEILLFNCLNDQFAIESNKSDINNFNQWIEENL